MKSVKQTELTKKIFKAEGEELVKRIRESEALSSEDIGMSWQEIEKAVKDKRLAGRKRLLVVISTAAAIACLIGFSLYKYVVTDILPDDFLSLDLLELPIEENSDKIVLLSSEGRIQLEDESLVMYGKDGKVYVNEKTVIGETAESELANENDKIQQIIVPKGKRANITFSDGTQVYINSGTRLVYPATFAKDKREILVDGEIFLSVAKDSQRPFIVKAEGMDVTVLGTKFNISSYKETDYSSVVLVEGSVEVKKSRSEALVLTPSQMVEFKAGKSSLREVDVYEYTCWIDNLMLLNDRPVGEVLDRLSGYYGKSIKYGPDVASIPISGKLDLKEKLVESIDIICLSLGMKYEIDASDNIVLTLK